MNPYNNYYLNQVGSGLPGFQGVRYQRGGGFFGRLFSGTIFPFLKQLLPELGKRALPSVAGLGQDILSGENVKESALKRLKTMGHDIADETIDQVKTRLQRGSGKRRKKKTYKKKVTLKRKKRIVKRKTKSRKRKISAKFDFLK
jgi:hypothetical protein